LIRLFLVSLMPGLLFGGMWLLFGYLRDPDRFDADAPWLLIGAYTVFASVVTVRKAFEPANTLWDALATDFPFVPTQPDTWPISAGRIGTVEHQALDSTVSSATELGLYLRRLRRFLPNRPSVTIPWTQVESIEVLEPDREAVAEASSREQRRLLSRLLHAKVTLARKHDAMVLLVPWSEEFGRYVPASIDLRKDWEWPYSVM